MDQLVIQYTYAPFITVTENTILVTFCKFVYILFRFFLRLCHQSGVFPFIRGQTIPVSAVIPEHQPSHGRFRPAVLAHVFSVKGIDRLEIPFQEAVVVTFDPVGLETDPVTFPDQHICKPDRT